MRLRRPVVLLLCALAVLLCLAHTGEGSVLGLDFGTEYFKGVLAKTGVPMEIVLNRETKRKTATVVGIADGQRFFGEDALAMKTKAPQDTFADLLGLLGRKFDDPVSQLYRGKYPNKMVSDPERGTVAFELTNGDVYRVEELVGMILMHAKDQAEAMGEEKVDGAVITVPPYFDQSERMALLDAARIAHLRVFSLMNVDTAAALNFGMTKKFDARQKHIFYDIGAGSTKVSLVSFGTRQVKEKSKFSTKPRSVNVTQFEVEAVAFNRELNGRELDFCLQDILAQRFQKQKGVTENVHQNKRAMAKILKEAQRVKAVLSVNSETMARIEGAMNDVDLVQRINRKDFEETCASVLDRAVEPLKELIEKNQLSLSEIDSVTLMGGGTRVPRIQALLKEYLQRELGQNLNTDEAAVFGAAFRAATLSKRFQVKDIRVKDITPYTVGLRYVSDADTNEDGEVEEAGVKDFKVFKRNTHQNTKKQVTFRKSSDFDFEITYSDDEQIDKHSGNGKVMDVFVEGFSSDKYQAAMGKLQSGDHPKISVTVDMDESGVISIEKAEATFTYTVIQEKEDPTKKGDKKESFSDKFFNFFSGKKADGAKGEGEQESEEAPTDAEQPQGEPAKEPREGEEQEAPKTEQGEEPSKEQNAPEQEAKQEEAGQPSEEAPKEKEMVEVQKTDRVRLRAKVNPAFKTLTDDRLEEIGARINKMIEHETKLRERVEALNALEAFTYAKREFLELADVIKVSTEEERQKLSAALSEASDWLYSEGFEATTEVLKEKMKSLLAIESPISFRHKEYTQRDETFGKLKALISLGKEAVKNISSLAEEARAQTSEDIEKAMKVIQEVETWVEETLKLQSAKKLFENPVATIEDILKKGSTLRTDLEKFMKKIKPKPKVEKDKPKAKAKKEAKKEAEEEAEEGERLEEEYEQEQREQQEQQEQEQEQEQEQQEEQEEQGQENGHGEDHQHEEL